MINASLTLEIQKTAVFPKKRRFFIAVKKLKTSPILRTCRRSIEQIFLAQQELHRP